MAKKKVIKKIYSDFESSNIKHFEYDKEAKALDVHFHNGSIYQYSEVPPIVVKHTVNAKSVGQAFNTHIKTVYNFIQIKAKN